MTLVELWDVLVAPIRQLQRGIDIKILWPECCRAARQMPVDVRIQWRAALADQPDLEVHVARAAFAMHAMEDPAWRCLGADRICETIDALAWVEPR